MNLIHVNEALRIFGRSIKVRIKGIKKYSGNSEQICRQIISDCYDSEKKYFRLSNGHFKVFYARDFGWVCKSLIELGYKEQVKNTLEYALSCYQKHGRITTSINPDGKPFEFPTYGADSLPYIVYCLSLIDDKDLVEKYKLFIESELKFFFNYVVDKQSGLVKKDKHYSSMKDHYIRSSSCYDNSMLFLLQKSCKKLKIFNPLEKYNYKDLLIKHFWNGNFFYDDLSKKEYVAGDANTFPFWVGAVNDKKILKKAIDAIRKESLDKPFPLIYAKDNTKTKTIFMDFLVSDYEKNVVWTHMGILFVDIVGKVDKKLQNYYLIKYKEMIEFYSNYLEVFFPVGKYGKPYSSLFYYSDEGMLWCANYLKLILKLKS